MSRHYVNVEFDGGKLDDVNRKIIDEPKYLQSYSNNLVSPINSPILSTEYSKAPAWKPDNPDKKVKRIMDSIAEEEEVVEQEEETGKKTAGSKQRHRQTTMRQIQNLDRTVETKLTNPEDRKRRTAKTVKHPNLLTDRGVTDRTQK
eukprot:sb/3473858/